MTDFTNTDNAFIKLRERTEYSGRHGKGNPAGGCGTAVSVLNAYTNTVLQILRGGSAVKFGEPGNVFTSQEKERWKAKPTSLCLPKILRTANPEIRRTECGNQIVKICCIRRCHYTDNRRCNGKNGRHADCGRIRSA